jgi:hypothetical protein
MDVYNDFFSRRDLSHFCQVSVLKRIMGCSYQDQLSIVMMKTYELGNFNASLFSTEGIASVGQVRAGFDLRVRARDRHRQPSVLRPSASLHPGFRRSFPAGSS